LSRRKIEKISMKKKKGGKKKGPGPFFFRDCLIQSLIKEREELSPFLKKKYPVPYSIKVIKA
ncbi:MAG: hypothetical protein KAU47_05615, partial [Candidatus Aminicenantes bacterium]|nr:hypothetical protein [Candidatus Aminicenantes bacterium]